MLSTVKAHPYGPSNSSRGGCSPSAYAVYQGDGNFVIYNNGQAIWASGTNNHSNAFLQLSYDFPYVQIIDGSYLVAGPYLPALPSVGPFVLNAGQGFTIGNVNLFLRTDGNMLMSNGWSSTAFTVVLQTEGISPNGSLDGNYSNGRNCGNCIAAFQPDGNFVLYGPQGPYWASNTSGLGGVSMAEASDKSIMIYKAPGASGAPMIAVMNQLYFSNNHIPTSPVPQY